VGVGLDGIQIYIYLYRYIDSAGGHCSFRSGHVNSGGGKSFCVRVIYGSFARDPWKT